MNTINEMIELNEMEDGQTKSSHYVDTFLNEENFHEQNAPIYKLEDGGFMSFVPRGKWAKQPCRAPKREKIIREIRLTYTETEPCLSAMQCVHGVRKMHKKNLMEGYQEIAYNFLVGSKGTVIEGRGFDYQPEIGERDKFGDFITIGIIGTRRPESSVPVRAMTAALTLVKYGFERGLISTCYNISCRESKAIATFDKDASIEQSIQEHPDNQPVEAETPSMEPATIPGHTMI